MVIRQKVKRGFGPAKATLKAHHVIFLVLAGLALFEACGVPYGVYHTVKKGQTLYRIAETYGVEEEKVMTVNSLKDPSQLHVGQKIFIPGAMKEMNVPVTVSEAPSGQDSRGGTAQSPSPDLSPAPPGLMTFVWPVRGKVFSDFGRRREKVHDGIDISAAVGEPIRAAASGRVIYSSSGFRGYGNIIVVKHEGRFSTVYAHNRTNRVNEGDFVEQGQVIGEVGKSGNASGPHLHFEIRKGETPVNPLNYLK